MNCELHLSLGGEVGQAGPLVPTGFPRVGRTGLGPLTFPPAWAVLGPVGSDGLG